MRSDKSNSLTFIIAVLFAGHCIGTVTHLMLFNTVIKVGFKHSAEVFGVPLLVNGYWLALTFIDPAIAFLLLKMRKIGVILAFANMSINVVVNSGIVIASLSVISLNTVYTSLGNIFNGLQIALLLFSAFTLPLFLQEGKTKARQEPLYTRLFYYIPFIALIAGCIIHLVGLIHIMYEFESLWVLWVHVSMTLFDSALLYSLCKRMKLGYLIGIICFSIFGLIQAGYAGAIFIGADCSFNLAMAGTITICCLSIAALMLHSNRYTISVKQVFKQL